uniref:Transthyretin-like family-containing protein n=1 Tax=Parastrongyloides trichosuri TaxID=131310 RepID=A0A0N4ZU18_PARTI
MVYVLKLLLFFIFHFRLAYTYKQGIKVEGRILCQKRPIPNLEIILMENDLIFDDTLERGITDKNGYFNLSGEDNELTRIEPYIKLTKTCPRDYIPSHHDTITFYVPSNALKYYQNHYKYFYNFGDIELHNFANQLHQFPKI